MVLSTIKIVLLVAILFLLFGCIDSIGPFTESRYMLIDRECSIYDEENRTARIFYSEKDCLDFAEHFDSSIPTFDEEILEEFFNDDWVVTTTGSTLRADYSNSCINDDGESKEMYFEMNAVTGLLESIEDCSGSTFDVRSKFLGLQSLYEIPIGYLDERACEQHSDCEIISFGCCDTPEAFRKGFEELPQYCGSDTRCELSPPPDFYKPVCFQGFCKKMPKAENIIDTS